MRDITKLVASVVVILIGGIMAGFGFVHYGADSQVWLLTFGATALVGLALLVVGTRSMLSMLPSVSLSIEH